MSFCRRTGALGVLLLATGPAARAQFMMQYTLGGDGPEVHYEMPRLPGSQGSQTDVIHQIQRALVLPASAADGYVRVAFAVGPDGAVHDAKMVKGISPGVDAAVLAAVAQLPRFTPATRNGTPIEQRFELGIPFVGPRHVYAPGELHLGPSGYPLPQAPRPDSAQVVEIMQGFSQQLDDPTYAARFRAAAEAVQRALVVPAEVRSGKVEGQVLVHLTVGPSGVPYSVRLANSLSPAADAAVAAAVGQLPRFAPNQHKGQPAAAAMDFLVTVVSPTHVYSDSEMAQPAEFPAPGLDEYVSQNLRLPAEVQNHSRWGDVGIDCVVGTDGRVRNAAVALPLSPVCDTAALRLVRALPAWTPARNAQGQAAPVRKFLKISFPYTGSEASVEDLRRETLNRFSTLDIDDGWAPGQQTYTGAAQMPQPPGGGGAAAVVAAIRQRLMLPAGPACRAGRVVVAFTVEITGTPTGAYVVQGLDERCDAAVLAAVRRLPRFAPGRLKNGQLVRVLYAVAVPLAAPAPVPSARRGPQRAK
ncbi:hypothetical protein EAH73_19545 [Hymenobacter nivis]|uniref:TonB C-terminal domain-containing protein n=1 Tax=Hymenobacter nivis TaxID=1850093 RepID=A0A502GM64_9BACT|nr:hypothetical protein EAH73_19545 [Hymenobacter nivis]